MHLARIRRRPTAEVELAVRLEAGADGAADLLGIVADDRFDGAADPVALLAEHGEAGLAAKLEAAPLEPARADEVSFEPPVATCSKICCLALNYADHAAESNLAVPPEPVLFFKPSTALVGHGHEVVAPRRTQHVEHEVELAVVIGRDCVDVPAAEWASVVAGYSIINDVTARDLQMVNLRRNQPWDQAKCFDTFAPLGPYLVTPESVPEPESLELRLTIGGELRQSARTSDMVFGLARLIEDLSAGMTLLAGDVIATGTMAGISPLRDGDRMHATVTGLGTLVNPVRLRSAEDALVAG